MEGVFYVNKQLEKLMFEELRNSCRPGTVGGFLPGKLRQNYRKEIPPQDKSAQFKNVFGIFQE